MLRETDRYWTDGDKQMRLKNKSIERTNKVILEILQVYEDTDYWKKQIQ